jgi:acetyl-CoA carboxylase biotin carboxyl carrier protein
MNKARSASEGRDRNPRSRFGLPSIHLSSFRKGGAALSEASEKPRPFDVRTIEYLVRLMRENDLSEIDLSEGEQRIRLRRGPRLVAQAVAAPAAHPAASAPAPAAPPAQAEKPAKKLLEIRSPTVGTFFHQRQPSDPPLVRVGDRVTPATPVGVIMAMKVSNEVLAECAGVIAEVCVGNNEAVEFNTVLFRVDPS